MAEVERLLKALSESEARVRYHRMQARMQGEVSAHIIAELAKQAPDTTFTEVARVAGVSKQSASTRWGHILTNRKGKVGRPAHRRTEGPL